ncbi:MAG: NAD(P)-dependent oxidoreductase [Bacteroidales bacterium]|nr:NAD(P)-dependent oxidoreductase [Bacteroidales bacterium]
MKRIIITGAGGLVATQLTLLLLEKTDSDIYLLSTHKETTEERYRDSSDRVRCFTLPEFGDLVRSSRLRFDFCFHTAFARSPKANLIVDSVEYQRRLLGLFDSTNLGMFVNISSQSVYGKLSEPLWKEDAPLDPDYLYAMGKYTSELVTALMLKDSGIRWTNIRLCSICENARFVKVFVQNAIDGRPIHLTAPDQNCSFIDIRDVGTGLLSLIDYPDTLPLEPAYNLGAEIELTIEDVAKDVKAIGESRYHTAPVIITKDASDVRTRICMDASLFRNTFHWMPSYDMNDMIISLFEMLKNPQWGGYPRAFKLVYKL